MREEPGIPHTAGYAPYLRFGLLSAEAKEQVVPEVEARSIEALSENETGTENKD